MAQDRPALEEVYRAYAPGLLAFLCARLESPAWAEDLLHDVFLAYMQQDSRQVRSPKWYLFRTAHRLSLNALRDQARASRAQHLLASRTAWETNDSDSAVAGELADSLARLPQEQRGILVLHTYAQMTFQEMASMLDMPLTTVFIRYRQGIESLRRILDGKPAATQEARP